MWKTNICKDVICESDHVHLTCLFHKKLRRGELRAMERSSWSTLTIQELIVALVGIVFEIAARFGITGLEQPSNQGSSVAGSQTSPATEQIDPPEAAGLEVPFRCTFCCSVCEGPCTRNKPYHNHHRCYRHRRW